MIAPTVSLGHLSTTDLAASTIGTAVASVTGYSIIQGFIRSVVNALLSIISWLPCQWVLILFFSSLDKILASAPNRRIAKISCAQAAVVTGVVLFVSANLCSIPAKMPTRCHFFLQPITNLWAIQSATLLQRLGQSPEVAAPASKFLQVTAAGLPGYAIGEISK